MLRNINATIDAENAEFKIARDTSSSIKKESVDNHSDDEDQVQTQLNSYQSEQSATIDKFKKSRLVKNEMLKASIKFNMKPKLGIAYLQ